MVRLRLWDPGMHYLATHGVFGLLLAESESSVFFDQKVLVQAARLQETIVFPDLLKPMCSVNIIFVGTAGTWGPCDTVRSRLKSHNRLGSLG